MCQVGTIKAAKAEAHDTAEGLRARRRMVDQQRMQQMNAQIESEARQLQEETGKPTSSDNKNADACEELALKAPVDKPVEALVKALVNACVEAPVEAGAVVEPSEQIRTPEEKQRRMEMRFKRAQNVVEAEALYVKRLGLMRDNFKNQLESRNILSQDDLRSVFSETATICGTHETMLDKLRAALSEVAAEGMDRSQSADHSTFTSMSRIFMTMASFLKVRKDNRVVFTSMSMQS